MKRFFIILFASLLCITCHAQKKMFEKAVSAGRTPDGYYVIRNNGGKKIKFEDLKEYAKNNGYLVGKATMKDISRFGDTDETVETFEFLPKDEYPSFIYSNIKQTNASFLSNTQNEATAYGFMGWENGSLFHPYSNVKWSGEVSNGFVEGKGVGYVLDASSKIVFVEGTFENGFPYGETMTTIYDSKDFSRYFIRDNVVTTSAVVGKMSDGMAMIEKNGVYGFINQEGKIAITPQYGKVFQEFVDGQAIVLIDGKESVIDRKGNFVDYSQHQKQLFAEAVEINKQGVRYYNENDYANAFELFKKAAQQDNAAAQNNLGNCYYYGHGVIQNYGTAVSWYGKAAEQGDADAQNNLGNCYYLGNGVAQSNNTAVAWYRKAAEQGNAEGQYNLGNCYWNAIGVEQSYDSAREWLGKSVEQGNEKAIRALSELRQLLDVKVNNYKLVKTEDTWEYMDDYYFNRLFTVLVNGKQLSSSIGEDMYVKILDEHDYDGDGKNECLINKWSGGNGIESIEYSMVYYNVTTKDLEEIPLDDDYWSEDPKAVLRDGKYEIVCKAGINTKTYVYNQGEIELISDVDAVSKEAVKTFTMEDVFGVDNVSDLPDYRFIDGDDGYGAYEYEYYDWDGDGVNEQLEFMSDTSHAYEYGTVMSLTIIWSNGKKTDVGGGEQIAILKSKSKGMPDVLFSDKYLVKWNGKKYVPAS